MNETTINATIEATETTTEATANTAVNTEGTVVADPATSVVAEAPANSNFFSAHKNVIIQAGVSAAVIASSAIIVRHVLKKRSGQPKQKKKGFKLPFIGKKNDETDSEAVINEMVNAVNGLGATVDAQLQNQGQVIEESAPVEPQDESTESNDNAQA